MNIVDTHTHLFADEFNDDIDNVISRAKAIGVKHALLPNIDTDSVQPLHDLVRRYPDFCIPMMGLHPTSVRQDWKSQLDAIYSEFSDNHYIAVGEIGIDLYWDTTLQQAQTEAFETQLRWSIEKDLPVSIHSRNAHYEVIDSIKRVGQDKLRGIFHSFGGNVEEMNAVLELKNFYVGINGVVTFKKSGLAESLQHCDLSKIVLETDSPYLAPVPYRGKRNESAYLIEILKKLAEIWGLSIEKIADQTGKNAEEMFAISQWKSDWHTN